jgi:hypothetical protein
VFPDVSSLITEPELREIARELRWDRQPTLFRQMLSQRG